MRKLVLSAALIIAGLFASGANAMPIGNQSAPGNSLVQKPTMPAGAATTFATWLLPT